MQAWLHPKNDKSCDVVTEPMQYSWDKCGNTLNVWKKKDYYMILEDFCGLLQRTNFLEHSRRMHAFANCPLRPRPLSFQIPTNPYAN